MSENIPASIGHFRILSKIGQGGMGSVYRAVHGTLERTVALKVLPPEFSKHHEYVSRFLREARVIAALKHENIINIHDSGEIDGQYYIAMDFIDGGNLLQLADARNKVSESDGLKFMLQAAQGLGAAHARGLIHRDIKPENLLLGTDGIVRLVDFGLVADHDTSTGTQLTQAGTCLGTPMYMSPEQADGEHTDARSDLYSLGATFFRVFTGRPPFIAPSVMNTLYKQKFERPPAPKEFRPELSQGTNDLLLHLLAKPRENRPPNARALVAMIEEVMAGRPIPEPLPFRPLVPKLRNEETIPPSVSPDGETAVLFGDSAARHGSTAAFPAQGSSLKAAMIVFALAAAVIFFIASNARKDPVVENPTPGHSAAPKPEAAVPPKPQTPPTLTEAELLERVALGDTAFREGRIREAREIYINTLKSVPEHAELILRLQRAERRMKFDVDMAAAEKLEKAGKLDEALDRYREAAALDEEQAAEKRIERVVAAIEQAKKPVAQFTPPPEPSPEEKAAAERARELETAAKTAQDFLLLQDYERAEAAFLRAAELATDSRKSGYKDKATQCKRLNFLAQARTAEGRNDFPAAEAAYNKALEISSDEQTLALLNALRQKMKPPEDKNLAPYKEAMREGQDAIAKCDYKLARVKFGVAMGLKPELPAPAAKLLEIECREALLHSDELKEKGDIEAARALCMDAMAKCPALESDVQTRLKELEKAPTRAMLAIDKAVALVKDHKEEDAQKVLDDASTVDANSVELKEAREALDSVRKAIDIYEGMKNVGALALQRYKEAQEIDEHDDTTKKIAGQLTATLKRQSEKNPLDEFISKRFKEAIGELTVAKNAGVDFSTELGKSSDYFARLSGKADEKVGVKIPGLPKFGIGGDRKKSEKYKGLMEAFKQLVSQVKDLQK